MTESTFTCPVCGWAGLESPPYATWPPPEWMELRLPYADQLGEPSYEVCEQCWFEFGANDDQGGFGTTFEEARDEWEADGRPFREAKRGLPTPPPV